MMDYSRFRPIETPIIKANPYKKNLQPQPAAGQPFAAHLQTAIKTNNQLTISKHAEQRLKERNININDDSWAKIQEKVTEAKNMGVNDSLVLLPNAALIVNAKNQTVITALGRDEASAKIFTNINGTIVL